MSFGIGFDGFPKDCISFFTQLAKNNNKEWFEANKDRYEESVMKPAREGSQVFFSISKIGA